ncbi:hypothetical protein [Nocardiopsis sp. CNR-923]|uniref:globin domain-containing protein n=1 Tax=Nocardiopsis sp. CNR-923 TaxID=1904965 RepID=UPI0009F84AA0|nr:hypothetical protein [Nocardiopsis sp. CNR-923]
MRPDFRAIRPKDGKLWQVLCPGRSRPSPCPGRRCRRPHRVLTDPLPAPVFAGFTPEHREHVAVWLAEVFGGPAERTERLGGHQALLLGHRGLPITEEQRARWMELMDRAVGVR